MFIRKRLRRIHKIRTRASSSLQSSWSELLLDLKAFGDQFEKPPKKAKEQSKKQTGRNK